MKLTKEDRMKRFLKIMEDKQPAVVLDEKQKEEEDEYSSLSNPNSPGKMDHDPDEDSLEDLEEDLGVDLDQDKEEGEDPEHANKITPFGRNKKNIHIIIKRG